MNLTVKFDSIVKTLKPVLCSSRNGVPLKFEKKICGFLNLCKKANYVKYQLDILFPRNLFTTRINEATAFLTAKCMMAYTRPWVAAAATPLEKDMVPKAYKWV